MPVDSLARNVACCVPRSRLLAQRGQVRQAAIQALLEKHGYGTIRVHAPEGYPKPVVLGSR